MIKSMTAYATAESATDALSVSTEIRSYNSRHLDIVLRMPSGYLALEEKLNRIAEDIATLLARFEPDVVAVEELYSHYAHPRTAILMGHARGVILQKCAEAGVAIKSFSATRIKKSLTGNGRASKEQVQRTIQTVLALAELPEPNDVADAIAAAMCCANRMDSAVAR